MLHQPKTVILSEARRQPNLNEVRRQKHFVILSDEGPAFVFTSPDDPMADHPILTLSS